MVLMPEAWFAVMDLFHKESTLITCCGILEPETMRGYEGS
ncbi:MAG: hypothetical protein ACTXOO_03245 [Sodalis sp. (in: enterobacteria)]